MESSLTAARRTTWKMARFDCGLRLGLGGERGGKRWARIVDPTQPGWRQQAQADVRRELERLTHAG